MKLLLTSGGVTNPSIRDALVEPLGKPIGDSTALCIPTAQWGHPMCGPASVRGFVNGMPRWGGMTSMEWKSLGVLELTALPSIGEERWVPWLRETDVLLVDGRQHAEHLGQDSQPLGDLLLVGGQDQATQPTVD